MIGTLSKERLGARFALMDAVLLSLLWRRMQLALEIGRNKLKAGEPSVNRKRESERLEDARKWALRHGLDPYFAEAFLSLAIGESCKVQFEQRDGLKKEDLEDPADEAEWYEKLRESLLELTKLVAFEYDDQYKNGMFATRAYLEYERELIHREIGLLSHQGKALDLGCATGNLALAFEAAFDRVVGYDVSPDMVRRAVYKLRDRVLSHTSFKQADLEEGIPEVADSTSFVMMGLGTAGDVREVAALLQDIQRVLKQGGRFLLSFYNRDALIYQWDYIPWPAGLAATIDPEKHYLEVHYKSKLYPIYARPYTRQEIQDLLVACTDLVVTEISSYPTISSVLPNDLFESEPNTESMVALLDRALADKDRGAYFTVTGYKK